MSSETTAAHQPTTGLRAPGRDRASNRARVLRALHPGVTDPRPLGSLAVIVPTYNTSATAPAVVKALAAVGDVVSQILVIDNASTDGTVEAIRGVFAAVPSVAARVVITSNPRNLGYGGSIKRGIEETRAFDFVAIIHSDDQCDPGPTLHALVRAMQSSTEVDVVLASRFAHGADVSSYSALRRLGNHFFNGMTRVVSGFPMSDAGAAIMLARASALADLPTAQLTSGYRFHPQLNLLLYGDARLTIREIPMTWHDASQANQFSLTSYGLRLLKMLMVFGWRRRVRGWSLVDAVVRAETTADRGDVE